MRFGVFAAAALGVLSGCTAPKPTQTTCVVAHESSFLGAGSAQERITVARNGGRCVIAESIGRATMGEAGVSVPPAHGTAAIKVLEEATLISYTPTADYVGADRFEVAFGPNFHVNVLVQVVDIGG
jgi:hypothetical protein